MESHCISLLEEIQAEVAQYVIDNIWSRGGESYNRFCEEISKRKPNKFIGCILNTKKPNDEKHMMFSFQLLSENTYMVSEKLKKIGFQNITSVKETPGGVSVLVTLNIERVLPSVLRMFIGLQKFSEQGVVEDERNHASIIIHSDSFNGRDVGDIRGYYLCSVARNLLKRTGKNVSTYLLHEGDLYKCNKKNGDSLLLDFVTLKISQPPCRGERKPTTTTTTTVNYLKNCKYCESEMQRNEENKNCVEINLRKYIQLEIKPTDNFLNDVNKVKVVDFDGDTTEFVKNVEAITFVKASDFLLHIVPSRSQYKVKSVALLYNMVHGPEALNTQMLSVHEDGAIDVQQDGEKDFQSWLQSRKSELWSSYCARYGSEIQGPGWERVITKLAEGSLKLDIFSTTLNKKIRFGSSTDENFTLQKSIFILYNYARLCKIEEHFQDKVKKGLYTALPDVQDMDFTVLKEDFEWCLVLRYVLRYHSLVDELLLCFKTSSSIDRVAIPAEKIYFFLSNMCRDLSKYYKQTKVLLDPQPHLLPLLHARVHLMSTIKLIMEDCFRMLGVEAPKQM